MTDQEIVAGRGENAEASGTLGLNFYGFSSDNLQTLYSSADVGQGSGAVAWLTGNFVGGPIEQIAQLWDNGGNLGLNLYVPFETALASFPDLGQGSGAVAWLAGNFFGGSTDAIAQLWDNGGNLGLNAYQMADDGPQAVIASSDLGQGSGAVAWLAGDFFGRGLTQIVQLWDNDGTLGAVVYGMAGGTVQTLFGSSDLLQGSGAVAWLTGNFIPTPSGQLQIAQLWDNDGTLSVVFYAAGPGNATLDWDPFHGGNLGQGPGALAWLTGDFTGSGLTEIAQPWDS